MGSKKSLYELLGVEPSAAAETISPAWHQRKRELEQQRQQTSAEAADSPPLQDEIRNQLAFIHYAHEVLSDPAKRARYDQSLATELAATTTISLTATPQRPGFVRSSTLLLVLALGAAIWYWKQPLMAKPSPTPAPLTRPVSTELAQTEEVTLPTAAPDLAISSTPDGNESSLTPPPKAASPSYSIKIDAENSALLKKLVWSVYGIVGSRGFGSGILVDNEQLLTNCHVLAANVRQGPIYAVNAVTRKPTAITEVAWLDHEDACLVRAPGLSGTIVNIALQSPTNLGAHTHNIGFVRGQLSGSQGELIGWANRYGQRFMVTNNYCDHGVSGGPLVDDDGRLIGLTTGGPASLAYCLSVTLDTIAKLRLERLKPLDRFPNSYASNVSRKN